jgi:NitT/TauT family transport system substrate-binding protein
MADKTVGPTALGKAVVFIFIIVLLGGAAFFFKDILFPTNRPANVGQADVMTMPGEPGEPGATQATGGVENTQDVPGGITTVSEYKFVPSEKLPPVSGVSNYEWDANQKVVEFPINVWIGWLPIVAANNGFRPNEESIFYKKYGFKVNLKLIDDPVTARDSFAAGRSHILWGTLDMMALFAPELMRDSRTAPRIYQQVDWSSGGDGIVVRDNIKTVRDLRGKTIVYAQNSPSQYFVNNILLQSGIQPSEVKHIYTATAFEAASAFVADKSIHGCVSWAPDIYNIPEKVAGTRILTTTAEANKLIADVWAVRADFARDHPEVVEGLVKGIFEGMRALDDTAARAKAISDMAEGYGMTVADVEGMTADAHSTNFAENADFFLNASSPTNFERTWKNINFVYRELGLIGTPVRFDEVMDFSIIKKLQESGEFADMPARAPAKFAPVSYTKLNLEKPILTQTIQINFYPNSANIYEPAYDEFQKPIKDTYYDPNVKATIETVGRLAGQYDQAIIAVTGHTDSSMKGKVPESAVRELSERRAQSVVDALVKEYSFDKSKFTVAGKGWAEPADPGNPLDQTANRRVEIAVYPPEQD